MKELAFKHVSLLGFKIYHLTFGEKSVRVLGSFI